MCVAAHSCVRQLDVFDLQATLRLEATTMKALEQLPSDTTQKLLGLSLEQAKSFPSLHVSNSWASPCKQPAFRECSELPSRESVVRYVLQGARVDMAHGVKLTDGGVVFYANDLTWKKDPYQG